MRALPRLLCAFVVGSVLAAAVVFGSSARASIAYDSPYTFEQTYGTALRLVRVDLGLKITEKDPDGGFLLFEYSSPESGKRVTPGSIEVVRTTEHVHVTVQLPQMPSYHEQVIVDALAKKLEREYGAAPRKPKPVPAPAGDAGADGAPGAGS